MRYIRRLRREGNARIMIELLENLLDLLGGGFGSDDIQRLLAYLMTWMGGIDFYIRLELCLLLCWLPYGLLERYGLHSDCEI